MATQSGPHRHEGCVGVITMMPNTISGPLFNLAPTVSFIPVIEPFSGLNTTNSLFLHSSYNHGKGTSTRLTRSNSGGTLRPLQH